MEEFAKHFLAAKEAGLGVTMHIAEVHISFIFLKRFTTPHCVMPDSG